MNKEGLIKEEHLQKYVEFISWCRWFPDLFFDLITPPTGGIRLDLDQRIFLRCLARFVSTYGVFPRGYGKTYKEFLGMIHASLFFPDIEIAMTAQTKENAAGILAEKWAEVERHYPLLKEEIDGKPSMTKDSFELKFKSGGKINVLANSQSSKGRRRKRLQIEESAQLNDLLFQDVLEPIPNIPRRTIGKEALINPEELNGQINFFTTSYFRGSSEYERNIRMVDEMAELKGKVVLGSDWQLACSYGRGETKAQILDKKANNSPTFFATNYESKWVGQIDGGIVNIGKLLELRTASTPEFLPDGKSTYVISVDVARSSSSKNNQTSVSVLKVRNNKVGRMIAVSLVNLINLPNGLNFTGQAIEVKRIRKIYKAAVAVVDVNGLGKGLQDELLKEHFDPKTGESLGCWDTINTDDEPEVPRSEKILYALSSQGISHDIIINFIDFVEGGKLELLEKIHNSNYDINNKEAHLIMLPHIQTDILIEEVANLKLSENKNSKKYSVDRVSTKVDKDRYSSLSYGLWYIKNFIDKPVKESNDDYKKHMTTRMPSYFKNK